MSLIDKEAKIERSIEVKGKVSSERMNIVRIEDEESSSFSLMSLYNIEFDIKYLEARSSSS